jgi:hypothetical protein
MLLSAALGFGVAVLVWALAERRRKPAPIGYGTWTSGIGFVFGAGTITASNRPTYSNQDSTQ